MSLWSRVTYAFRGDRLNRDMVRVRTSALHFLIVKTLKRSLQEQIQFPRPSRLSN